MINIQQGTFTRCHKYLDKIGTINQKNVQKSSPEIKDFLRGVTPVRLKELANMNCLAANKIKTELDKRYGENNYVLIAVGRSVSSIAELMGKIGVDTKIIPLSGLRKREADDVTLDNLHIYKSFLVQKGLSKTDLAKNKDKTFILMDYTYYGRSLERAERLLKKKEMLGNADNLIAVPISDVLGEDYNKMGYNKLFEFCRFKDYSYVGRLHVDELNKVYEKCTPERNKEFSGNITQGLRKLFWFNVFDILDRNNIKNEKPKAEMHALFTHHLSPKAINNLLNRLYTKNNKEINSLKNT